MGHAGDAAVDTIIKAATAGEPEKIYFLGPFARRISFATQQTRALNLIWALLSKGVIKEGDDVAVIGAGLSGITAAASLVEAKCNVTVLEATNVALWRQAQTEHRIVHPTINQWPEKDPDPTTAFPFFDWYASECASALKMVLDDWKKLYIEPKRVRFVPGVYVDKPMPAGNRIGFRLKQGVHNDNYDAVIVATGFSEERRLQGLRGFTSYWDPDRLEHIRDSGGSKWFLVTGCGDGGLIDALRLVYRTESFAKGRLAIDIAVRLGPASLSRKPTDPPSDSVSDIIYDAETQASASMIDSDGAAHILFAAYTNAVNLLPKDIADDLRAALVDRNGIVTLVGKEPHPFSRSAAPIHKLLLIFAKLNGKLEYVHGVRGDEDRGATFTIKGRPHTFKNMEKTVVRYGAPLALKDSNFLLGAAFDDLERRQFEILDIFNAPHWQNPTGKSGKNGHPVYAPMTTAHMASREARATEFLTRTWPLSKVGVGKSGFTLNLKRAKGGPKVPETIFGIRLRVVENKKVALV